MSEQQTPVAQQVGLYGAPLAQVMDGIATALGMTHGRIAQVLGISAPMMSHLVSARRVKIGNPVANARLVQLRTLADQVAGGVTSRAEADAELARIAASADSWTTTRVRTEASGAGGDTDAVRQVQELFRAVADAQDWLDVARLAEPVNPRIAELLRAYGASRTAAADEHWHTTLGR